MALTGLAACQYMRARYAKRKASGLCVHCGKRKPYPGMVSCLECRTRLRTSRMRYNFKRRAMKAQGLTWDRGGKKLERNP